MNEIGFVSRRFLPAEGGVEHFLYDLVTALRQDYSPRMAAQILGDGPDFPGVDDVLARYYPDDEHRGLVIKALAPSGLDRLRLLPCALKLLPGLRRVAYGPLKALAVRTFARVYLRRLTAHFENVALIHSFAFDGPGLLGCRAAARLKVPFVITPFVHPGKWGDGAQNIALYNAADAVLALHAQDAEALKNLGVREELVRTCGVGINSFSGQGNRFREKHNIRGLMVLFIGRMIGHKGYRELTRAAVRLRQEGREITLVLIGPEGEHSEKFFKAHAGDGVLVLGQISDQEKNDALFACDLFCLPSKSEIMPMTILEAWWAGKPVLAGDIPALRAFVDEGKDGLFVRQGTDALREALLQFITVPGHFRHLGENGRKKVEEHYLIRHVAERTRDLYIEVMQRKKEVTRVTLSNT